MYYFKKHFVFQLNSLLVKEFSSYGGLLLILLIIKLVY